MTAEVFRILFYYNLLPCENPRHKQHLKRFLKKYPTSDKNGEFPIITVNPEDWAISLEDPKTNTTECCRCYTARLEFDLNNVSGLINAYMNLVMYKHNTLFEESFLSLPYLVLVFDPQEFLLYNW
jgi:hypothetical protein